MSTSRYTVPRKRKRKIICYEESETSSPPEVTDYDERSFKKSTSMFNYIEEEGLKITITPTNDFEDIVPEGEDFEVPSSAKDLFLETFSEGEIRLFDPEAYNNMDENISIFLIKLKMVLDNNAQLVDVSREEGYIDDMMREVTRAVKYDDGKHLIMKHCSLKLTVGDRTFAAIADREGRRGSRIVWIIQENKHVDDARYKGGDIQLASCMIAACQTNYRNFEKLYPGKMMGIKVKGDEVHFYSLAMSEKYLIQLFGGLPRTGVSVNKYPLDQGLRISDPEGRKAIITYLWKMRNYALTLER